MNTSRHQPCFSNWLDFDPYTLGRSTKAPMLTDAMVQLTRWHASRCEPYRRVLEMQNISVESIRHLEEVPFIPVRLFKEFDLLSVDKNDIFKTLVSSGTSGQQLSRIFLDKNTAAFQSKALSRLMVELLGRKRLPMLVIDSPSVLKDRQSFSARGAGILGFSIFGKNVTYALNSNMELDEPAIHSFVSRHAGTPLYIFGFTYMIWQYFLQPMRDRQIRLPLDTGLLLHGGGWKKLEAEAIDAPRFRSEVYKCTGIAQVVNYYGMVEQTGSIFMECDNGYLHAPSYADVIVRDPKSFDVAQVGSEGIIEVLSILPGSYPGHALLTEDLGVLIGEDDCPCGRSGKYFIVNGRLPKAEIRGCSDTHEINL